MTSPLLQKTLTLLTGVPAKPRQQPYRSHKAAKASTDFLRLPARWRNTQKSPTERELISAESRIGAEIFGAIPQGTRREFFNLDPSTWIWHEATPQGESTVRYEVHDHGILKVLGGARYEFLEGEELNRFMTATRMYYDRVACEIYGRDPQTGQKVI